MMDWNGSVSWWGWTIMSVGMFVFWAFVAWIAVTLVRNGRERDPGTARAPQDILAERYAKGEIDAEEYHSRLTDLPESNARARR